MKLYPRLNTCLTVALLAGCSVFQPEPAQVQCPTAQPETCPVCVEQTVQELQCPEPEVLERVVTVTPPPKTLPVASTAGKMHLPIVGAVEWATIEPSNIKLEARVDTGAETTSVHAEDIELGEKDGKRYVYFSLLDPGTGKKVRVEERLRRKVLIRQSEEEQQRRYVVRLWVTVGKTRSLIDVTLTDRESMDYPMLIGRNFLMDTMIVDVSRQHLTPP